MLGEEKLLALAGRVVDRARQAGAEVAEALVLADRQLEVKVHRGAPELVSEADSQGVGLRVLSGGRQASTYTNDTTDAGLQTLVENALELLRLSEPDPFAEVADQGALAKEWPALELFDPRLIEFGADRALVAAKEAEAAAFAADPRIENSDGAECSRSVGARALVSSNGFAGSYAGSHISLVVAPIAEDRGGKKQRGHYYGTGRFLEAIADPSAIGREAATRTTRKLGAEKIESAALPVVFDPDAGRAILSLLCSVISGDAIAKRSSFLVDQEGQVIASPLVTVSDDPLILRGPGSRPFDGEGLPAQINTVVRAGTLETYLLDLYNAKKLGRKSTASATRGLGGRPGVAASNFVLHSGAQKRSEILAGVPRGLYVTSMMGFGFNAVTGDFSRGAEGFLIENGELGKPVAEVTISLNLGELLKRIDAVGDDPDLRSRFICPTFRVSEMTVAGR